MTIIVPEGNRVGLADPSDAAFNAADYGGSGRKAPGAGLATQDDGGEQRATARDERRRRELAAVLAALGDDHQRNIDDAAVKKAYVQHSDEAAALLHGTDGLLSRTGIDAHATFPEVVQRLAESHDQALAPLTEDQRGTVAAILADRLRKDVAVAGAHVHAQGIAEQRWQSARLQQAAARDAIDHVDDPDLHDHHMATGENAIRQQGMIDHLPDRAVDRQVADYRSAVYAASIAALAAREPRQAAQWYARFGDALNGPDRQRVESTLIDAHMAPPSAPTFAASEDPRLAGVETIAASLRPVSAERRAATPSGAGGTSSPVPAPATPVVIHVPEGKAARNWPLLTPGQPDVADGNGTRGPNGNHYADGWYDPEHRRTNPQGGKWRLKAHYGVDFKSEDGNDVYAAAAGKVLKTGFDGHGWGYYVAVASPDGYVQLYGHLTKTKFAGLAPGSDVAQGQVLGTVGNTGNAEHYGDHLHFEVRRSNGSATLAHASKYQGSTVDPLAWLRGELPDARAVGLREAPYLPLDVPTVAKRAKAASVSGGTTPRHPPSRREK
ncbi:M23 family metallopeptidase [Sphingomonas sp. RT2P30]|uniref:M23 family metallopeptidase n=1 Tax=Parasphingomonas halimpatiens TaxID=3096162 RepID=UPI002FCC4E2D